MRSVIDTPNNHGMFMLGEETLFLCHMPMFTTEDHMYQLICEAELDASSWQAYLGDKKTSPAEPFNLVNVDDDKFTLPEIQIGQVASFTVDIYRSYSGAGDGQPSNPIVSSATVTVRRVVVYRHFDRQIPRPLGLTYYLFGAGDEAFLSHYIAGDPDFQHILRVAVPSWIDEAQLRASVKVQIRGLGSTPIPCAPPIGRAAGSLAVRYEGWSEPELPLEVPDDALVWFSTANALNSIDPCAAAS